MKLLFDQNISFRVVRQLISSFPESESVYTNGLIGKKDFVIWTYAKKNDFTIISQDDDFDKFFIVKGFPPKIILLRTGNIKNPTLVKLLIKRMDKIKQFIENYEQNFIEKEE
jgi:predicted nuclease of predicted toxin-antitoxin system